MCFRNKKGSQGPLASKNCRVPWIFTIFFRLTCFNYFFFFVNSYWPFFSSDSIQLFILLVNFFLISVFPFSSSLFRFINSEFLQFSFFFNCIRDEGEIFKEIYFDVDTLHKLGRVYSPSSEEYNLQLYVHYSLQQPRFVPNWYEIFDGLFLVSIPPWISSDGAGLLRRNIPARWPS